MVPAVRGKSKGARSVNFNGSLPFLPGMSAIPSASGILLELSNSQLLTHLEYRRTLIANSIGGQDGGEFAGWGAYFSGSPALRRAMMHCSLISALRGKFHSRKPRNFCTELIGE